MSDQIGHKIRIFIVETSELFRMGLRSLIDGRPGMSLIAETDGIEDFHHLILQHKPDVILYGFLLNESNDIYQKISKLLSAAPKSKILAFVHDHCDDHTYLKIFQSGVAGIIHKQHSADLLLKAINVVHKGQVWFDRHTTELLWRDQFASTNLPKKQANGDISFQSRLTEVERYTAYLACKGLSAKQIASQLSVTEKTVRNRLSSIYKKMGVKKQVELCLIAPQYDNFQKSYTTGIYTLHIPVK